MCKFRISVSQGDQHLFSARAQWEDRSEDRPEDRSENRSENRSEGHSEDHSEDTGFTLRLSGPLGINIAKLHADAQTLKIATGDRLVDASKGLPQAIATLWSNRIDPKLRGHIDVDAITVTLGWPPPPPGTTTSDATLIPPLYALRRWLTGRAATDTTHLERDELGRPTRLQELGWTLRYTNYKQTGRIWFPGTLQLLRTLNQHDQLRADLAVSRCEPRG